MSVYEEMKMDEKAKNMEWHLKYSLGYIRKRGDSCYGLCDSQLDYLIRLVEDDLSKRRRI